MLSATPAGSYNIRNNRHGQTPFLTLNVHSTLRVYSGGTPNWPSRELYFPELKRYNQAIESQASAVPERGTFSSPISICDKHLDCI